MGVALAMVATGLSKSSWNWAPLNSPALSILSYTLTWLPLAPWASAGSTLSATAVCACSSGVKCQVEASARIMTTRPIAIPDTLVNLMMNSPSICLP